MKKILNIIKICGYFVAMHTLLGSIVLRLMYLYFKCLVIYQLATGYPRELFPLIICYRMGPDNFYYICMKRYISSFKMSTETLLRSEYN